jgi:pyruvate ferredoxin oxidoreductase gamma subunit
MFRIRFHGRGGQGMKTASRIAGTAAFRQGYYAQDSPIYGAERRGAPMMAFTRFDGRPILERGVIATPDLVVIADPSLLTDPLVRPLRGLVRNGTVLINSTGSHDSIQATVVIRDFTGLALSHTSSTAALSVALGSAAARLAGIDWRFIEHAVREELRDLNLDTSGLERNVDLARASFSETSQPDIINLSPDSGMSNADMYVVTPSYEGPWAGTASVASSANTPQRKTGDWRVMRPVIDTERCTHCWICYVHCPDGAITLDAAEAPHIDYGVCKGCLICAEQCPIDAIGAERESEVR